MRLSRPFRLAAAVGFVSLAGTLAGATAESTAVDILCKKESPCYWQAYPSGEPAWHWGSCASATVTVSNLLTRVVTTEAVAKGESVWGTLTLPTSSSDMLFDVFVALDSGVTLTGRVARVIAAPSLRGKPGLRSWSLVRSRSYPIFHHDASRDGLTPETAELALQSLESDGVLTLPLLGTAGFEPIAAPTGARKFDATLLYDGEPFATATLQFIGGFAIVYR